MDTIRNWTRRRSSHNSTDTLPLKKFLETVDIGASGGSSDSHILPGSRIQSVSQQQHHVVLLEAPAPYNTGNMPTLSRGSIHKLSASNDTLSPNGKSNTRPLQKALRYVPVIEDAPPPSFNFPWNRSQNAQSFDGHSALHLIPTTQCHTMTQVVDQNYTSQNYITPLLSTSSTAAPAYTRDMEASSGSLLMWPT